MPRFLIPTVVALASLLTASPGLAQGAFGGPDAVGTIILSVDRLFGVVSGTQTEEVSEQGFKSETTVTSTEVSLLGRGPATVGALFFSTLRLALDFLISDGLTLGGGIGFASVSQEVESEVTFDGGSDTTTDDGPTVSGLVFAPRIGYLAVFNETVGIWPREASRTCRSAVRGTTGRAPRVRPR